MDTASTSTTSSITSTLSTPLLLAIIVGITFLALSSLLIRGYVEYSREYIRQKDRIMEREIWSLKTSVFIGSSVEKSYVKYTRKDPSLIKPRKETVVALKRKMVLSVINVWEFICFWRRKPEGKEEIQIVSLPVRPVVGSATKWY
jgi:hypothetical protein